MDFASYREAYGAGELDGLYGRPRRSTALAYTKGYDPAFAFYLAHAGSASPTTEAQR